MFTTEEARDCGLSGADLRRALSRGEIVRLKRGWFTAQPLPYTSERHRLRVVAELRDHPGTIPSHYSAAVMLGLPVHAPEWGRVHLMRTGPGAPQNRVGSTIHRQVGDASRLDAGLAAAQTALLCPESGLMALDSALRLGRTTAAAFQRWARLLEDRAGRRNLALVARLADARRESPLESRTAPHFDRWGYQLEPQFAVPGTRYRADARIVGTAVLVEADGQGKYDTPGAAFEEKVREDDLRAAGWEVVRVTHALLGDGVTLLARTRAAIERQAGHSRPTA